MFERFTEQARRVIFFAHYETSQFGAESMEPEHFLLALFRGDPGLMGRVLPGVSLESVREQIERETTRRPKISVSIDLPLSHSSKRVLAISLEEAEKMGHPHITPDHLFLGLLREPGLAARILESLGVKLEVVRGQIASSGRSAHRRNDTLSPMLADKKALTLAVVKRIAAAAEQEAIKNKWNMFIAIVDDGGNLMYLERMDDSQLASQEVSVQKARCALLFKRPTKALEDAVAGGRVVMMSLANAVPVEGGLPLMAYGKIVGAIGISGATSPQDGIVAKAGVDELEKILAS